MKTLPILFYFLGLFVNRGRFLSLEDPNEISHLTPEIDKEEDGNSVKININLKNEDKKK